MYARRIHISTPRPAERSFALSGHGLRLHAFPFIIGATVTRTLLPASRRLALVLGLLACGLAPFAAAQSFSTLEERMSVAQFRAAGLDKLSPEELAQLNAWLQQNVGGSAAYGGQPVSDGPAVADTGDGPVHSRILGEFRGWEGKTIFKLENGQVWQQVGNDPWRGVKLENPSITIRPGFMNSWTLRVEGYNTTTKVRRIR